MCFYFLLSSVSPYRERENGSSLGLRPGGRKVRFLNESEAERERGFGAPEPLRVVPQYNVVGVQKKKKLTSPALGQTDRFLSVRLFFFCVLVLSLEKERGGVVLATII